MTGRVMLITGANSGLGFEVAKYLAEGGNDIVLGCRDEDKGEDAVRRIKALHPNSLVQFMKLDLSSTTSVREFVKEFVKKKRKLNVLINNAGMALSFKDLTRHTTREGNEITMATNHLGPFLLTNLLLDYMIQTSAIMGDGRIINITCGLHDHENNWATRRCGFLSTDNFQLQNTGTYSGIQAYKNSKLCNVLFTYSLADQLRNSQSDVTVNAVDPGTMPQTQLMRKSSRLQKGFSLCCLHHVMRPCIHTTRTVKQSAMQICNVATSEKYEGITGKYFKDGVEDRASVEAYDSDLQKAMWKISSKLVHLNRFSDDGASFDDISLT